MRIKCVLSDSHCFSQSSLSSLQILFPISQFLHPRHLVLGCGLNLHGSFLYQKTSFCSISQSLLISLCKLSIDTKTNYHMLSGFNTNLLYHNTEGQKSRYFLVKLGFCSRLYQAKSMCEQDCSTFRTLGIKLPHPYSGCWPDSDLCDFKTEVSISVIAFAWGSFSTYQNRDSQSSACFML